MIASSGESTRSPARALAVMYASFPEVATFLEEYQDSLSQSYQQLEGLMKMGLTIK